MRVKTSALPLAIMVATFSWQQTGFAQDAQPEDAQKKAAEVINNAAKEGDKSFEQALDAAEETAGSLLSDGEEAPYLFEYEYEYEYDSEFEGNRRPNTGGNTGTASSEEVVGSDADQQDRIAEAQKKLAEAQQFAPKSRVREQFVSLGGESLSTIGLYGLGDLVANGARGLLVQPSEFSASSLDISLRGIGGTTVDQVTGESGVGVFLDGVPVLRGQALSLGLIDLESIDLLRGSSGVVSGRNAVGGAIYMKSRKPSGEFGFRQRVRFGFEFDDVQSITNIDLPSAVGLPMARISYLASQREGRVDNLAGSQANDFNEHDNEAWRIALTSVPSDKLSIDLSVEGSEFESTPQYYQALSAIPSQSNFLETDYRETARSSIEIPLSQTDRTMAAMTISYVANENLEIKPILGWSELEDESFVNFDGRMSALDPFDQANSDFIEGSGSRESFENRVGYFELQANGRAFNKLLNYSIGFTSTDDKSDYEGTIVTGEADLRSTSVYLQTVWTLSERLKLTAGVRDTEDEKDFERSNFNPSANGTPDIGTQSSFLEQSYTDFALAVDYDVNKTLKAYASYANAHKAGGSSLFGAIDPTTLGLRIYDNEEATTLQFGIKGALLDSKLYFDAALFTTDIDDRQIVFNDPDNRRITDIVNATDTATVRGAEFDLRYKVNETLRLGAFITVLDTDANRPDGVYEDTPAGFIFNPAAATESVGVAHIERAPDYSFTLTADYKFSIGQSRNSVIRLEYVGTDDFHFDAFTETTDSRSLLNARLLFSGFELEGADDGKVEISLWANNLLDEEYLVNAASVTSISATTGQDRSFVSGAFGDPVSFGLDVDFVF